ncbi:hypothetical protein Tco_1421432 [Tanacetum coccineum]
MDLENAQTNATTKLPLLKQGDYEMWKLMIEQYFQVQDYARWDVIENGNSFKPIARTTVNADGTSTSTIPGPGCQDSDISVLIYELEKLKKEKESNKLKIDKFENVSKSLDKLIGSQITDNSRKGIGFKSYNAIPPPPTGLFAPPTIDFSNSGLEEFQQPEFKGYVPKAGKSVCVDTSNEVKKTPDASLVEELVSEKEKQTIFPTKKESVKQQEKPARKLVKYVEMYRSQKPRGNQRN